MNTTNSKKTHCKRGHPYTPETTKITKQGSRQCMICVKERMATSGFRERKREVYRVWRDKNKHRLYGYNLKSEYGLSVDDYNSMLDEQGGTCAICLGTNKNGTKLHVDHDHDSGEIRGILCSKCNTAIGLLGDDPRIIARATNYLWKYKPRCIKYGKNDNNI